MERVCDFCKALRPVVYCKADAAYLCLSCDAKVHSANALSGRHPRALVCEFCGSGLVNIRCPNHCLLLCHSCDRSMHKDSKSSQHQKQVISCCYFGCPSAKDLAKLWGFNLDEFGLDSLQDKFISTSCLSGHNGQSRAFGEGSSDHSKVEKNIIIQQILDLEKLQLSDRCQNSSVIRGKDLSICNYDASWELENNNIGKHLHEASFDFDQQVDSSQQELNPDPFLLASFPQLDQLTSNSGNPLQDSSFWQYKSPTQKFQLWSQNMQDLGKCEEVGCIDDLNMPDVDLTFRNFEELFGGGGGGHDLTEESSVDDKDTGSSNAANDNEKMGHSRMIRPTSHLKMSCSMSRFCTTATKSNATDCSDSSLSSPAIAVQGKHKSETKDIDVLVKKNRQKKKDCKYNDVHESGAAVMRKRVKGRFVKGEEFHGENVEVTQSY